MNQLLDQISHCIEYGKVNLASPFPPDMKGQEGADELTKKALEQGFSADEILQNACVGAMHKVGIKFAENKIFVPQMLMSAKAMGAALEHLKPFFQSGEVKRKGKFVIGTVCGDLHDIGKNLAAMMIEGAGWEVIDLGVDVKTEQFMAELDKDSNCIIGLSAMLTTTMVNMDDTVKQIKTKYPQTKIIIGGAPVTDDFKSKIGASFYAPTPQEAVNYLAKVAI